MTTPPPEPTGLQKTISQATGLTAPAALACVEALALDVAPHLDRLPDGVIKDLAAIALAGTALAGIRGMSARGDLPRFCADHGLDAVPGPADLGIR